MRLSTGLVLAVLTQGIVPTSGLGQATRLNGLSMERFYDEGGAYMVAFSYRRTELGRSHSGLDLGAGVVPAALPARVFLIPLDVGMAQAVPIGPASILLRGGAGTFVMFGTQSALYPGALAGVALLLPFQDRSRIRVDVARRLYISSGGETILMWSVGLGVSTPEKRSKE